MLAEVEALDRTLSTDAVTSRVTVAGFGVAVGAGVGVGVAVGLGVGVAVGVGVGVAVGVDVGAGAGVVVSGLRKVGSNAYRPSPGQAVCPLSR